MGCIANAAMTHACTLQTGSIFISPPASQLPANAAYPKFTEYPVRYDKAGYPAHGGDVSGKDHTHGGQYAFYLNEIRSAVQNVTSPPSGDINEAFACNPAVPALRSLLNFLIAVQGNATLPISPPLVTGPLPDGEIPQ